LNTAMPDRVSLEVAEEAANRMHRGRSEGGAIKHPLPLAAALAVCGFLATACGADHHPASALPRTAATVTVPFAAASSANPVPLAPAPAQTTSSAASPPASRSVGPSGQTAPSGNSTCERGAIQTVLTVSNAVGGGTVRVVIGLRNTGTSCNIQGFPSMTFLNSSGTPLPGYVARSSEQAKNVALLGNRPPIATTGNTGYPYFEVLGTNMTTINQPCPTNRVEQPAGLRVTLPGGAVTQIANVARDGLPFFSCDGRIQIGPVVSR